MKWSHHCASRIQEDRIDRCGAADEEPVSSPWPTAERDIGDHFWNADFPEQVAFRRDGVNAIASAGPDIAVLISAKAVGTADIHLVKYVTAGDLLAIIGDIEDTDMAIGIRIEHQIGLGDIETALVR